MTTRPDTTLRAIIGLAEALLANLDQHHETEVALLPAELHASGSRDGGRSADHPDPTGNLAVQLVPRADRRGYDPTGRELADVGRWAEFVAELDEALGHLRSAQRRQTFVLRQHPDIARDADATARALRCDGSIDPLCTNNAVKGGLCWKCIKRRQRERYRSESGDPPRVHPELLEHATVEQSAATTVAECGRCGWTTPAHDIDHAKLLLDEHHIDGTCPASVASA